MPHTIQIQEKFDALPLAVQQQLDDYIDFLLKKHKPAATKNFTFDWEGGLADPKDERVWYKAMAANPAFDFLKDPAEDIYTLDDGRPFHDEK